MSNPLRSPLSGSGLASPSNRNRFELFNQEIERVLEKKTRHCPALRVSGLMESTFRNHLLKWALQQSALRLRCAYFAPFSRQILK